MPVRTTLLVMALATLAAPSAGSAPSSSAGRIAFATDRGPNLRRIAIYSVEFASGSRRRVATPEPPAQWLTRSPNGRLIAYSRSEGTSSVPLRVAAVRRRGRADRRVLQSGVLEGRQQARGHPVHQLRACMLRGRVRRRARGRNGAPSRCRRCNARIMVTGRPSTRVPGWARLHTSGRRERPR